MKSAKLREFVESIYSCAKKNEGKSIFKVGLSGNLWEHARRLISIFESEYAQNTNESGIVTAMLFASFYLSNQEEATLQ